MKDRDFLDDDDSIEKRKHVSWRAVSTKEDEPDFASAEPVVVKKKVEDDDDDDDDDQNFIESPKKVIKHSYENIDFSGKNLASGNFSQEDLEGADFSGADLQGVDLTGANLRGVDFSGANLHGADFTGADLTGAIFNNSDLSSANLSGTTLKEVDFYDANIEDCVFLDIDIDDATLENLQEIIEYLAKYYPEKLNLNRFDLTQIDLKQIDLSKLNLRGVDFTGVDFTGVNIFELDLSECIISPEQIAQAMGRVPSLEELHRILEPKLGKAGGNDGIDFTSLFKYDGKEFGVWDFTKSDGIKISKILDMGKKVFRTPVEKPAVKEDVYLESTKERTENRKQSNTRELREVLEARKREVLEKIREEKQREAREQANKERIDQKQNKNQNMIRNYDKTRGDYER